MKCDGREMDIVQLCELIGLQENVVDKIKLIDSGYEHENLVSMWAKLYHRNSWDDGIRELQQHFGNDEDGIKILTCILHCSLHTYDIYMQRGIDERIFIDTFKFLPRFLEEYKQTYGFYRFTWAWWFPRQLALQEFRLGTLEYELISTEDSVPQIYIHIPSDARLQKKDLRDSYFELKAFLDKFFPEYMKAELFCESWLIAPALKQFLKEDSRILYFQNCFEVISVDIESNGFMDWLYKRNDIPLEELPEDTSLQRNVKSYLLKGGKIGWALGRLKNCFT